MGGMDSNSGSGQPGNRRGGPGGSDRDPPPQNDSYDLLVNRYMNAPYTPDRAYRTYIISKMRNVQRIFLKE